MQRLTIAGLTVLLGAGCGTAPPSLNVAPAAGSLPAIHANHSDWRLPPTTGSNQTPTETRDVWIAPTQPLRAETATSSTTFQPSATSLPPVRLDGGDPSPGIEPRELTPPEPGADANVVAVHVAEVWGNGGPDRKPWFTEAAVFLTPRLVESLAQQRRPAQGLTTRATVLQIDARSTTTGHRVTLTMELELAARDIPWRLITVEVLVADIGGRWLVASFEVGA